MVVSLTTRPSASNGDVAHTLRSITIVLQYGSTDLRNVPMITNTYHCLEGFHTWKKTLVTISDHYIITITHRHHNRCSAVERT